LCLSTAARADEATIAVLLEGAKLGAVPEVLYAQVPDLPAGQGILVLEVAPGSVAAKAGLKQYDVLLSLDTEPLRGHESLQIEITVAPTKKTPVVLFRAGREMTLHVAPARPVQRVDPATPKAMLKAGGPPAVAVEAKPLRGDRLTVTFTYFAHGSSKLEHVKCSGSVDEIKKRVKDLGQQKRMPQHVQDLADVALERLRVLNAPAAKK
jgi:hypothetical protein